jgi:N6-L-threonylcarbamoyladenine synthase
MLEDALNQAGHELEGVDAFAATLGPGLAGCLLTGATLARALAWSTGKPFLGVNHLEAHLLSPFEGRPEGIEPCVALVVSGGHTLLVEIDEFGSYTLLSRTRDDAAGEAFDKCAKMVGLPYPGGPEVDRLAREENADPQRFDFPRAMLSSGDLYFSFSGLKTSVRTALENLQTDQVQLTAQLRRDLCASFQEAIVDVLCAKLIQACRDRGHTLAAVSGGVSLNSRLRARLQQEAHAHGIQLLLASPKLCTDNAAMICYAAAHAFQAGQFTDLNQDVNPNMPFITQTAE